MSDHSGAYKPDGWSAVTPRLFTTDDAGLVHVLNVVFDAKGDPHADRPSALRYRGRRGSARSPHR